MIMQKINQLGKSFPKVLRGIIFHPILVSTLPALFDATSISTFAKTPVISSMEISVRVISFGPFEKDCSYLNEQSFLVSVVFHNFTKDCSY